MSAFGSLQILFGGTGIGTLSPLDLVLVGMGLFAICGAFAILRHEWLIREFDSHLGNEHARRLWEEGIPVTQQNYFQYVKLGNFRIVQRFWLAGLVNLVGVAGRTDLYVACENGHAVLAEELIRQGSDPKRVDQAGHTPLMVAVAHGHAKVIDAIFRYDCGLNAKATNDGCSALFIAACHGHQHIADLLAREGAEIDAVNNVNLTPLMAAIAKSQWKLAEHLLESGADPSRVDAFGATTMDHAIRSNAPAEFIQRLREQGIKPASPKLESTGSSHGSLGRLSIEWRRVESDAADSAAGE